MHLTAFLLVFVQADMLQKTVLLAICFRTTSARYSWYITLGLYWVLVVLSSLACWFPTELGMAACLPLQG